MTQSRTRVRRLVLDASAVVAILLDPGPRGAAVGEAIGTADLHAPALLPFEVANVLRRQRLAGRLSRAEEGLANDGAARLPIEYWPFEVVAARTAQLGDVLTAYDASYVALAEFLGAALVTADARLARAPGVGCELALV